MPQSPQPGTRLLCVDDTKLGRHYTPSAIVSGHIYSVRELYVENGVPGVLVVGISGPVLNGLECGFQLSRFRTIDD
jgi:hypothetical protein